MVKRLQITMEEELSDKLDTYADTHFMTRSGVISLAVHSLISTDECLAMIGEMRKVLANINRDDLSESDRRDFDTFNYMAEIFLQRKN